MSWIFEQPWPVLLLGVLMEAMLFAGLWNTGQRSFLWGMGAVGVLTGVLLFLGYIITTPFEEVRDTLHMLARAIEQDDRATVLSYIYTKSPELKADAEREFKNYRVTTVSVKRNLTVTFNNRMNPPEALARFNVVCEGTPRGGTAITSTYPATLEVIFRKEDGRWRVSDYREMSPLEGLREKKK